jgi:hypothetical protein
VAIKLDFYSKAKKEICVSGYPTNPIFVSAKFRTNEIANQHVWLDIE